MNHNVCSMCCVMSCQSFDSEIWPNYFGCLGREVFDADTDQLTVAITGIRMRYIRLILLKSRMKRSEEIRCNGKNQFCASFSSHCFTRVQFHNCKIITNVTPSTVEFYGCFNML